MPETIAYIDGLNLYYGALKNRPPLKWLNPLAMLEKLFPQANISRIQYFSALTRRTPTDPDAPARQTIYFRALQTIPILEIHRGRMAERKKTGIVPSSSPPRISTIEVFEEKRTDVNIGSYLLMDAFEGRYDTAVVVSNDSDLTTPIEMVAQRLKKTVIIVNPYPAHRQSSELRRAASGTVRQINSSVLRASQFPNTMTDARGAIRRHRTYV